MGDRGDRSFREMMKAIQEHAREQEKLKVSLIGFFVVVIIVGVLAYFD